MKGYDASSPEANSTGSNGAREPGLVLVERHGHPPTLALGPCAVDRNNSRWVNMNVPSGETPDASTCCSACWCGVGTGRPLGGQSPTVPTPLSDSTLDGAKDS